MPLFKRVKPCEGFLSTKEQRTRPKLLRQNLGQSGKALEKGAFFGGSGFRAVGRLFSHAISGLTRNRFARIGGIDRSRMSMDSFRLICLSPPGELITNACFLAFLYKLHIFFKRFFGFLRCFVGQMRFTGFIVKIEPFFIVLPNKIFMSYQSNHMDHSLV